MGCFGFEEQYAMFDMTPVDNQFILEYLPAAKGDDLRVYLYGLMMCYHPQADMTIEKMARELRMSEEEVLSAYRRWERKGLVQRISDSPAQFRYVAVKRVLFTGARAAVDEEYEAFAEALYAAFGNDRRLHGKEIGLCYEWVEELHLSVEVVIRLVEHMIALHGKGFSIKSAQKLATMLADEKCATVEDADVLLARDASVWNGAKDVLTRMGKRRNPTVDEQQYYRKWLVDWGFSARAILAACAELIKGEPNFAYLDGILKRHHQRYQTDFTSGEQMENRLVQERETVAPLKALLQVLGVSTKLVNEGTLSAYQEMREMYPDNIILMAGRECARYGLRFDDVSRTLQVWKRQGLETPEDVEKSLQLVRELNDFLQELYSLWHTETRPNAGDRSMAYKWLHEWKLSEAFIVCCAAWAQGAEKPILYLNKLLDSYRQQGITTPEAAVAAHYAHTSTQASAKPQGKVVREQQYTQREYTHSDDAADQLMEEDDHAQ